MNTSSFKVLLYLIFTLAVSFRIVLAAVNKGYANDNHLKVSTLILETGKIPEPQDCWECNQQKLYHFTVAKLWTFLQLNTDKERFLLAQLINAIAGIFTIVICWLFIKKQPFRESAKLLCFSLVALNPGLIAINAQASNDSFVILFGTIVIYSLYKLMNKPTIKSFLILLIFSILAGITKTNSLVLIVGVISVLVIKIISNGNYKFSLNKGYWGSLIIYLIATMLTVGYFGEYFSNYKKYGKPLVYTVPTGEMPHLYKKTSFFRPGVQSIIEGYFTFRIIDMIKHPIITNDKYSYPLHRTSVWSQLYGRANFIYFDDWPPGPWQCNDPKMMTIGRVALSLALIPFLFFLFGLIMDFRIWSALFFRRKIDFLRNSNEWIFHIFIVGYLIFIILFTAIGRDFSYMKMIYIFPGILAVLIPLLKGGEYVYKNILKNRILFLTFHVIIFVLLLSYLVPIINLITRLT
ncbi:MAG TPA: phospholipid carrier-dependent glycosyltransferase [Bacteroidales bacterium]